MSFHRSVLVLVAVLVAAPLYAGSATPLLASRGGMAADTTDGGVAVATGTATYYVSTTGNDRNPGTSAAPWRTLQRAANAVSAGATVYIGAGTYAGFKLTRSGAPGAPITFRSRPGDVVKIAGDSAHPNVVHLSAVSHVVLARVRVLKASVKFGAGIFVEDSSHVTITGSTIRANRSFGILIEDSTTTIVRGNTITENGTGVRVRRAGSGVVIVRNRIHTNNRMVVNDSSPGNDYGAQGVALQHTTGRVVVRGNLLWGNRAPSIDWGEDGTAFEIYGASNVVITGNRVWNNSSILETGTDGPRCNNLRITRNVAYSAKTTGKAVGMMLRCASNSLVAHNTIDGVDFWAMQLVHGTGSFSGSLEGLRVLNNIVYGVKSFHINTSLPRSVVLDYNLVWAPEKHVAYVAGRGYTKDLRQFRSWTGYEVHGLQADPRFVSVAARDYRLRSGSPAVDRGLVGVDGRHNGAAPDLGRYER